MKYIITLSVYLLLILVQCASLARAQADLYPFPRVDDIQIKKSTATKTVDLFVRLLSKKTQVAEKTLTDYFSKGFGRGELLRLILISKKSGTPLDDLVKEREKGTSLAKIAGSAHLNSREIRKETNGILNELDKEEDKVRAELAVSSPAAQAPLTAGTTDFILPESSKRKENIPLHNKE